MARDMMCNKQRARLSCTPARLTPPKPQAVTFFYTLSATADH